ncbi:MULTISPECIES: BadF/BadG/BcrA/BcrD ATPase family protein [unclassified Meiothermus]|uniref:BadF/BadG/BcrA/BcrD ATPase family protein n=1 Tax=unclassified Meiothermus TaxID=370471 RepID=UPI000D7CFCD3|nr:MULTISPECIES: BadF/BadG/BcrA/BcrD ATPase family protein [unclassified Meiothermus]PZA06747.1 ATPase [Meiothermus sp. Pnk-1]RYM37656.1 ATPase [Meiothermus sp. PNK-Is4]
MSLYRVGVDAGGTAVRAVLARKGPEGLEVLGRGTAGSANPRQVGLEAAHRELRAAIEAAFREAGLEPELAGCAVHAGVAGLATPEDLWAFEGFPHPYARLEAQSDATLTLSAYFAGEPGVLLVVGTGCIALARGPDGRLYRRMGWGFPLEQGGGSWLGLEVLRLALSDWENAQPSPLAEKAREHFSSVREAIEWARGQGAGGYGQFAPWVFAAAATDPRAARLLREWHDLGLRLVRELQAESGAGSAGVWGGLGERFLRLGQPAHYRPPRRGPLEQALLLADRLAARVEPGG